MKRSISPLLTDFYHLTMLGGYWNRGIHLRPAVFEYFFRNLPPDSGFAIFAGLEDAVHRILSLRFSDQEIGYLERLGRFSPEFLKALARFRFTGNLDAAPEGTMVFPHEPLVRVEAPLWEAQLLETLLLNSLNYPTLVAGKSARICLTARPHPVMEFGLRRAQGADGGLTGSRAAYIGGCQGTSNVAAGHFYGIPLMGTHAHSWVMAFENELEAFRSYLRAFPLFPTLLVDTYDTLRSGVPNAITAFQELKEQGWTGRPAIRIDSGDLAKDSMAAHRLFQESGFEDPLIVASNELDEYLIADLIRQGARINAWGVGTRLITAAEAPALSGVYKLVAVGADGDRSARIKISGNPEKTTDPGVKNVMRYRSPRCLAADLLSIQGEELRHRGPVIGVDRTLLYHRVRLPEEVEGRPILEPLFRGGRLAQALPGLEEIRNRAAAQLEQAPPEILRLRNPARYPVLLSERLAAEKKSMLEAHSAKIHRAKIHRPAGPAEREEPFQGG